MPSRPSRRAVRAAWIAACGAGFGTASAAPLSGGTVAWTGVVVAVVAALLAGWAARRQARRVHRLRVRNRLLLRAALEIQRLEAPDTAWDALARGAAQAVHDAQAFVFVPTATGLELAAASGRDVPVGTRPAAESLPHRAYEAARPSHHHDVAVAGAPFWHATAAATGSATAIPLFDADGVRAVLHLEHPVAGAFAAADLETAEALARLTAEAVTRQETLEELREGRRASTALAELGTALSRAGSVDEALRATRHRLHDMTPLDTVATLTPRDGRWRVEGPQAHAGQHDAPATGVAPLDADATFVEDARAAPAAVTAHLPAGLRAAARVPVTDDAGAPLAVLVVADTQQRWTWPEETRRLLLAAAHALGAALQRLQAEAQLWELLGTVRSLARSADPDELYRRAADAVVRLVPGADAASVMVRDGDTFRFVAAHGYDEDALRDVGAIGVQEELRWYRRGPRAFARGEPRILTGDTVREASAAATREPDQARVLAEDGRLDAIRANVCVPIVFDGTVIGILNVDAHERADALGPRDAELAEAFAQQIGVIIRQTEAREALATAVVTDPVTGLGNREGFNRRVELELARARRHGHAIHLVMMDLDGLKRINDRFGHEVGDEALKTVASAMRREVREEDGLFRWGGDEFALLLSGIDTAEARTIAERYADAVARHDVHGVPLRLSVGIASYPDDGLDADALLRRADDLMYRRKPRGDRGRAPQPDGEGDDEASSSTDEGGPSAPSDSR